MRVLICGAGVIGACTAWFLSLRGVEAVVIERTGVACAASGKSGGFLALDWCDGGPLQALARRSFALHAELAAEIGEDWCYRRMDTFSGGAGIIGHAGRRPADGGAWLSGSVDLDRRLGSAETTAQVHPGLFTAAMMRAAGARGASLIEGAVTGVTFSDDGRRATGVLVDGRPVAGDAVVIAMGPWSVLAAQWLSLPAVYGLKGHSLVFDTGSDIPAEALFLEYAGEDGFSASPEVFPRSNGTTYICGVSSEEPLPVDPAAVAPDPAAIARLEAICTGLSPRLAGARISARQACFRPVTRDGLPLMGAVAGVANAYVATGHSVWGILNGPASGEAMAELIVDGRASTVDIARFDPARLPPLDPAALGGRPASV